MSFGASLRVESRERSASNAGRRERAAGVPGPSCPGGRPGAGEGGRGTPASGQRRRGAPCRRIDRHRQVWYSKSCIRSGPRERTRQPGTDTQGASRLKAGMRSRRAVPGCDNEVSGARPRSPRARAAGLFVPSSFAPHPRPGGPGAGSLQMQRRTQCKGPRKSNPKLKLRW
jgi:hypothetical protein